MTPPPRAPKSSASMSQHLGLSPGSPSMREVSVADVFDASTEAVVAEHRCKTNSGPVLGSN